MIVLTLLVIIAAAAIIFAVAAVRRQEDLYLLSPSFGFLLAWSVALLLYFFGGDYFLQEKTVQALGVWIGAFVLPGLFLLQPVLARKGSVASVSFGGRTRRLVLACLFGQSLAAVAATLYFLSALSAAEIAFGDVFDADLSVVRRIMATSDYEPPLAVRLLGQLKYLNYLAPIVLMQLWLCRRVAGWLVLISVLLAIVHPVIGFERSGVVRLAITFGCAFLFFSRNLLQSAFRVGLAGALVIVPMIIIVPILRDQGKEAVTSPYEYIVGALSGLDAFISGHKGHVDVLEDQPVLVTPEGYTQGSSPPALETATDIYRICKALSLCDVAIPNHKEYVYAPIMTNTYTGVRSFYQDYGFWGLFPSVLVFSLFLHLIFLHSWRSGGVFSAYIIGYCFYISFITILTNNFLLRDLVITALIAAVLQRFAGGDRSFWWGQSPNKRTATAQAPAITTETS